MDDDLSALRRIQAGDEDGLRDLMSRHKQAVFRLACRYTGNEADAAELTEEVFYRVYRNASRFRPRAKVRTWIFSIAANLCRDHLRRSKKRQSVFSLHDSPREGQDVSHEDHLASSVRSPSQEAGGREVLEQVESAIRSLPEKLGFPFVFCVLEGHSYDECAEVLQANRKTVENRIYRARIKLRRQLKALGH